MCHVCKMIDHRPLNVNKIISYLWLESNYSDREHIRRVYTQLRNLLTIEAMFDDYLCVCKKLLKKCGEIEQYAGVNSMFDSHGKFKHLMPAWYPDVYRIHTMIYQEMIDNLYKSQSLSFPVCANGMEAP